MKKGFTLSELLIALAILGVIATFTIPKVLQSQKSSSHKAKAKEIAGMIAEAYQAMKLKGTIPSNTTGLDLIPYFNYVKRDTSGATVDAHPGWGGTAGGGLHACSNTDPCLRIHNGGALWLTPSHNFGGTGTTNAIQILFDPDGIGQGGTTDAPNKSVQFTLYYNGFITTRGQVKSGSCDSTGCAITPDATLDPSWFSWD